MLFRTTIVAALVGALFVTRVSAQDSTAVVAAAAKAMGTETLTSITYSGTARTGAFGQSKNIGQPMGPNNLTQVTQYTRTLTFAQAANPMALISRATGPTRPPTVPGIAPPMPGVFNQNITGQQASGNWTQALNVWTTPWGFLKGAAANAASVRRQGGQQVVSFSPAGFKSPSGRVYTVTGYINNQNLVTKVETRVEHGVAGDLLVEFEYSGYQNMNGVQVPTRMVQRQAGLETFDAMISAATPNPANLTELLTPPPAVGGGGGGGAAAQAAGPAVEKIGDGAFKIGGNYAAIAVDMGDHILVVESGQSDERGKAVMAAAKQAIPGKPVRFVVNSHPHFDHAGGLRAAAGEGATILMHRNSADAMTKLMSATRTLGNDSLATQPARRVNIQGIGDREIRRGTNGRVVEIHRVAASEHTDSHLMVYLPAERLLYTADTSVAGMPNPNQVQVLRATRPAASRPPL
ncbi:MAG: MBL fold metallo-hydrolase, partial [Acidobacteria bacterium]|nr:MBL fold metallo-hydrolase [Acidobacteriota bacterium]